MSSSAFLSGDSKARNRTADTRGTGHDSAAARRRNLLCGWLLLRSAETAAKELAAGGLTEADPSFCTGKVATGRFFARTVLPRIAADLVTARNTDAALLNRPNSAF
ncbi:acyl-CoA dehydrogenase C-terminal domain-containing protein [Streptomyces spongiae]|uniref:acyl-CoA dehydrogenase C-terminal domain-containing protein n=1 Tax=Streptomyces spongiae TaxID=565072 RepID=UPI002AD2341E|nr:acyl-CoA dehydrogenase C-terminal domain-containing protein [Streptomyces spongiae]